MCYLPGASFNKAHVSPEFTLTTNEETGAEKLSHLPVVTQLGGRKLRRLTHTHTHHTPLSRKLRRLTHTHTHHTSSRKLRRLTHTHTPHTSK